MVSKLLIFKQNMINNLVLDILISFFFLYLFHFLIITFPAIQYSLIAFTYTFLFLNYIDDNYSLSNIKIIKWLQLAMFWYFILLILYLIYYLLIFDVTIKIVECQPNLNINVEHVANTDKLGQNIENSAKAISQGLTNVAAEAGAAGVSAIIAHKTIQAAVKAPTPASKLALTTLSVGATATTYALAKATNKTYNVSNPVVNTSTTSTTTTNTTTQTASSANDPNFTASSLNDYLDFNYLIKLLDNEDAFYTILLSKFILTSCILMMLSILINNLIVKNWVINKGYNLVDIYIKNNSLRKWILIYFKIIEKGGSSLITVTLILLSIFMTINWYYDLSLLYNYDKIIKYIISNNS